jgi:hypothetical protein
MSATYTQDLRRAAFGLALTYCTLLDATIGIPPLTINGASKHEKRIIWGQHFRGKFPPLRHPAHQGGCFALQYPL